MCDCGYIVIIMRYGASMEGARVSSQVAEKIVHGGQIHTSAGVFIGPTIQTSHFIQYKGVTYKARPSDISVS